VDKKAKVNGSYYVIKLLPNLIKDCRHLLSDNFIFQQDGAPAHTAAVDQEWTKKKCPGFIGKTNGHRIRQISFHWIIMCAAGCWDAIRNTRQNRSTLPSWTLRCYRYGMICHRSSLIRQSCHFERDFDRLLLQLVYILNTQKGQLTFITETFELLTKKLCEVWFVITQYSGRDCVFTWKKMNFKV